MVDASTCAWWKTSGTPSARPCSRFPRAQSTPASHPSKPPRVSSLKRPAIMPAASRAIREWYVSPGFLTERMYLFLCEDLEPGPTELAAGRKASPDCRSLGRCRRHGQGWPDRRRQVDPGDFDLRSAQEARLSSSCRSALHRGTAPCWEQGPRPESAHLGRTFRSLLR